MVRDWTPLLASHRKEKMRTGKNWLGTGLNKFKDDKLLEMVSDTM